MENGEEHSSDQLKKDLEDLNEKIKNALVNRSLSAEELNTLIKETEEIKKRLVDNKENTEKRQGNI